MDLCACHLPDSTMDGYAKSLQTRFKFRVSKAVSRCYYPQCSQSEQTIKTQRWKENCGTCPDNSGCVTSVDIDFGGNIQTHINYHNYEACEYFGAVEPFESEKLAVLNPCTGELPKTELLKKDIISKHHSLIAIISVVSIGATVAIILGSITIKAIFKKRKK